MHSTNLANGKYPPDDNDLESLTRKQSDPQIDNTNMAKYYTEK